MNPFGFNLTFSGIFRGDQMKDNLLQNNRGEKIRGYFTSQELVIIIALAIIAFLTANFGLNHVLPGGGAGSFVHGFLILPGPGTGVFIGSAFICLWLVLGLLLIKKPGTAILISALIMILTLVFVLARAGNVRMDYLALMVAIIIECAGMLPLEKRPWNYLFPAVLTILGIITLVLMLTGNAKMGENGAATTVFPLGYAVTGILSLCIAIICYSYPSAKYIAGAGCAEIFYIVFSWLYTGKTGFASWVPVVPAIPPLLAFACVCGALMAVFAYGFSLLIESYTRQGTAGNR
jgi:hypothetical protein